MPYSGRYINPGAGRYLLCHNTRYQKATFNPYDGFPFPVKLRIESINTTDTPDTNTIHDLINQVSQFSLIYWKSVKQQNLPVTIKYHELPLTSTIPASPPNSKAASGSCSPAIAVRYRHFFVMSITIAACCSSLAACANDWSTV